MIVQISNGEVDKAISVSRQFIENMIHAIVTSVMTFISTLIASPSIDWKPNVS